MSDPPATDTDPFAGFQATLDRIGERLDAVDRMEQRLTEVCSDVEELKRGNIARNQAAQLPVAPGTGVVQSTTAHSAALTPVNADNADEDGIVTRLTWGERMELEDENEDRDSSMDRPGGDKVCLTKVHQSTEEFLRAAFTSVSNVDRRQLRQRFIVPDTPFTAAPRLDKVMATECSKNLKSADTSLSRIQALFLDAVGPLSDLLDKVNSNTELSVEDMEGAVKAALTFIGNASSQCTALRRTGILDEYNKDLVSFSQESGELFASATNTLFGPSFPEKAAEHIKQLQTLRQARGGSSSNRSNQVFSKAPLRYTQRGGKSYTLQRRGSHPYYRGGARGRGAPVSQRTKSQ